VVVTVSTPILEAVSTGGGAQASVEAAGAGSLQLAVKWDRS
jgi:hypothetical protein